MFKNILFLTHPQPNYVPDLLLHGLRKVLGDAVVDYPRKDCLYEGSLGQPFLSKVPGLFGSDARVDRDDVQRKAQHGFFDLVIRDVRTIGSWISLGTPEAVIDGEDVPEHLLPYDDRVILRRETDGTDFSIPLQMAMPEELLAVIDKYRDEPKRHSVCFIGSRHAGMTDRMRLLEPLQREFPDAAIRTWDLPGNASDWTSMEDYYRTMQASHCVLSLPGAGMDTFRYWENAACNSVHVAKWTRLFVPDDFEHEVHCFKCGNSEDLENAVYQSLATEYRHQYRERSREHLLKYHTTERRAVQTLDRLARAFGS